MIACVIHGANDLKIENRPAPSRPQDDEVLVRFGAGGISGSDVHYYHEGGILDFKIREPLVLGHEVAGEVVEIGRGVTKVSVGHRVAVNPLQTCHRCVHVYLVTPTSVSIAASLGAPAGFRMFKACLRNYSSPRRNNVWRSRNPRHFASLRVQNHWA